MKKIASILLFLIAFGCSSPDSKKSAAEKELAKARKELKVLQKKIAQLETQLENKEEEPAGVRVKTEVIALQPFSHYITVNGEVKADQNIAVSPETGGNIISIEVKEGQKVTKGQVLGRLNTKTIENGIAEIETNLQLAETLYERQLRLWEQNIGSEVDLLTAKTNRDALKAKLDASRAQLEMAIITSPIDGVVDDIYQKIGEPAGPGIPFARVVNLSKLYIYGDVSEAYLMHIQRGDALSINFPAINHTIEGVINQKSNIINPDNRTFRIRVNINNPDGTIKPNLLAEMKIRDYFVPEAIVVPSLAVIKDFKGEYLFVAEKEIRIM